MLKSFSLIFFSGNINFLGSTYMSGQAGCQTVKVVSLQGLYLHIIHSVFTVDNALLLYDWLTTFLC